jgi:flagellar motor component MotA
MSALQSMKFSPCRLIGLAGVLIVIVGAIVAGGSAAAFIHIPSMVFMLGVTFFVLLATFGTDFLKFIPQSILTFISRDTKSNPRFAEIALFASRYIIGAGLIGMVIGLFQMFNHLSDPENIGPGMAVVLLTAFYAIVTSEIFCAFLYKAYSDGDEVVHSKPLPLKNAAATAAMTALTLILFFVLITSFVGHSS